MTATLVLAALRRWWPLAILLAVAGYVGVLRVQRDTARAEVAAAEQRAEVLVKANGRWAETAAEAERKHQAARDRVDELTAETARMAADAARRDARELKAARELEAARVAAITATTCRGAWAEYLRATGQAGGGS